MSATETSLGNHAKYLIQGVFLACFFSAHAISIHAAQTPVWKPEKRVELVVPSGPGGTDRTARVIQKILQDSRFVELPTVVINKPGGGGTIGWSYVNQHAGDPHFLAMTQPALLTNAITGSSTIDHTKFTPIVQLASEYVGFAVKPDSPIKESKDLLERVKQNPGSIVFGVSNALGAPNHLALALVMKAAGIDVRKLKVVVFASGGESMTALLGGHVQVIPTAAGNLVPQVKAGTVRVVAVTSPKRLDSPFANVPTWKETGVNAVVGNWRGIVGPPGMTKEQVAFWEDVFARLVKTEEWRNEIVNSNSETEYMDSQQSKRFLESEYQDLAKILGELGLAAAKKQ